LVPSGKEKDKKKKKSIQTKITTKQKTGSQQRHHG
jgi:hypothetical protein